MNPQLPILKYVDEKAPPNSPCENRTYPLSLLMPTTPPFKQANACMQLPTPLSNARVAPHCSNTRPYRAQSTPATPSARIIAGPAANPMPYRQTESVQSLKRRTTAPLRSNWHASERWMGENENPGLRVPQSDVPERQKDTAPTQVVSAPTSHLESPRPSTRGRTYKPVRYASVV
jgi:hypothetical protein